MATARRIRAGSARRSARRGVVLSVAGPDGVGKTTLATAIAEELGRSGPVLHVRFPRLMPRRDPVKRYEIRQTKGRVPDAWQVDDWVEDDVRRLRLYPPPYPILVSLGKIVYLFVDFLLGWSLRIRPFVRRGGSVVFERGWFDYAVDPRRYRLSTGAALVRVLGHVLPRYDLVIVLEATAESIRQRKPELPPEEVTRQSARWRRVLPRRQPRVVLDATQSAAAVERAAMAQVASLSTSGDGNWIALPPASGRFLVPRSPRRAAAGAMRIYHPVTARGLVAWNTARLLALSGTFRFIRRGGQAPPGWVSDAVRDQLDVSHGFAVAKTNHPGRYVALGLDEVGAPSWVAKLARDETGMLALRKEAECIGRMGPSLHAPLSAPRVIVEANGLLGFEAIRWQPRRRPWQMAPEVAHSMGIFWHQGLSSPGASDGFLHGDFAPWNLLRTGSGWVVIDWESAGQGPPYFDLFHYFVQGCALLRKPSMTVLVDGLSGRGPVAEVLDAYAAGAGSGPGDTRSALIDYLRWSYDALDRTSKDLPVHERARAALLQRLGVA
jgi:DNA polymerase III delta prime subunit